MNTTERINQLQAIIPFFVVADVSQTIVFYTEKLGFTVHFLQTLSEDETPSFCILGRDEVSIMFKFVAPEIQPTPNSENHKWARWDAYIATQDPDYLYEEFKAKELEFHRNLGDTDDGLRAFEIRDNSGYILCFAKLK